MFEKSPERFSGESQGANKPETEKTYDVEDNAVRVSWKEFQQEEKELASPENSAPRGTVIFLPGWSITEQAKSIEVLCKEFADYSGAPSYAVEARTEKNAPNSTEVQAEAVRRFIEERDFKNVTLVGNSLGGVEAIHLTAFLQKKNPDLNIDGLVLLDSMSLYDQTGPELAINYAKDFKDTRTSLRRPPRMGGADILADQNKKYIRDGIVETLKEAARSNVRYPGRLVSEIRQMTEKNPHLGAVKAPIVMIQGARDLLSSPQRIIPTKEAQESPKKESEQEYIKDIHEREKFLQEHVFTNSPYVRMIVPEKMGHHNLPYSRPESVAKSSLYLLERWHREKLSEKPRGGI